MTFLTRSFSSPQQTDLRKLEPLTHASAAALDPRDVLGSVWATLEPLALERGVALVMSPGRDQARLALVDAGRLHQALLNLLENALHYSPDGAAIDVSLEQRDRWCLIEVRDRGPGQPGRSGAHVSALLPG